MLVAVMLVAAVGGRCGPPDTVGSGLPPSPARGAAGDSNGLANLGHLASIRASSSTLLNPAGRPLTSTLSGGSEAALEIPVEIRGRKVNYRGNEGRALFTGGVTVDRGTTRITCDELETIRGSSEAIARGHVLLTDRERQMDLKCDLLGYTHGLRQAAASGTCQLISGVGDDVTVVTARSMEVFLETREATAHEDVRIIQGPNEATCLDAHLYGAEDRVVLTGRPVLRHPPHEFVCDQAVTYFKSGRTVLTGGVTGRMTLAGIGDLKREGVTP